MNSDLEAHAKEIRYRLIRMSHQAQSAHLDGALSCEPHSASKVYLK